jgi:hypothetical protein
MGRNVIIAPNNKKILPFFFKIKNVAPPHKIIKVKPIIGEITKFKEKSNTMKFFSNLISVCGEKKEGGVVGELTDIVEIISWLDFELVNGTWFDDITPCIQNV